MPKCNIIYTSPQKDHYVWDGTSLTKLEKAEQETLRFSGKSFKQDELDEAIKDCKKAIEQSFPKDENPEIKTVKITVSD
ncbi:hypothetical protein HDF19_05500 [Mucilaginibacter sp. E4BP6]|uniref:hypothetical protein n=1 Tax=Mucilaginibacter sp. E4BP6 TaxID=2723089 RepID=UPI0015CAC772|nr:hypothetical protein [Mucilaginibacter sp. E4BP6]NYE68105.1 hypothetical protein [Mucilaginibacter sp. E4BP6]